MSFERALESAFPGALPETDFVRSTAAALEPHGFRPDNTMPCVASCRDEISQSWAARVTEVWGAPFCLTGLGGWILAGKTGFGAALAHAPDPDGRERYLFLAGPHIAFGAEGEPGVCRREGRSGPSSACGALAAILGEVQAGTLGATGDPDDLELGALRRSVGKSALESGVSDLISLTHLTHDLIADDLERMLGSVVDTTRTDYAVRTGVQIHLPEGENRIWPGRSFAVVGGVRRAETAGL